jgi:hypothetical protein
MPSPPESIARLGGFPQRQKAAASDLDLRSRWRSSSAGEPSASALSHLELDPAATSRPVPSPPRPPTNSSQRRRVRTLIQRRRLRPRSQRPPPTIRDFAAALNFPISHLGDPTEARYRFFSSCLDAVRNRYCTCSVLIRLLIAKDWSFTCFVLLPNMIAFVGAL